MLHGKDLLEITDVLLESTRDYWPSILTDLLEITDQVYYTGVMVVIY